MPFLFSIGYIYRGIISYLLSIGFFYSQNHFHNAVFCILKGRNFIIPISLIHKVVFKKALCIAKFCFFYLLAINKAYLRKSLGDRKLIAASIHKNSTADAPR